MTTDLGLIMHTTESDTHILSSKGTCNRLSKTRLADARRAVKAKNRRLHVTLELQYGKILDNSFLYLIKSVVVLIQNLLCMLQIKIVLRDLSPRQIEHELNIVVLDAVIR